MVRAETCHNEALPLAKKHGLAEQGARLLSSLADIEVHRDNLVPALKLLDQSLAVFIETGDAVSAARTYLNVGSIHRRLRKPKKAFEAYDEVEKILQGDKDNQLIISRIRLASVLLDMNKIDSARNHAMIAHDLTLDVDFTYMLGLEQY